ncbi:MAG: DUF3667 domain-containing protein [Bacteroidota bacterium]
MDQQNVSPPTCANCQEPLVEGARFCYNCGQKRTDGRVTLLTILKESLTTIFNIDSKIIVSLKNLLIPGKLTVEYFKGRHKSYVSPFRLFLVSSILMIATITFQANLDNSELDIGATIREEYDRQLISRQVDTLFNEFDQQYPNAPVLPIFVDSLQTKLAIDSTANDSIDLTEFIELGFEGPQVIAKADFLDLNAEELIEAYQIEGFFEQILFRQKVKFFKQSRGFISYLLGRISWLVLLILPSIALFMKLLYIRRPFYYVEHLVFSFHIHAFSFFLLSLFFISISLIEDFEAYIGFIILIIIVYLYIAMKRFYQQSWPKTLFKYFIAMLAYNFVFAICIIITAILGFLFF